jgi:glycosyltransferase involved in cell wall biosynthesis
MGQCAHERGGSLTKPLSILYVTAVPLASGDGPSLHVTQVCAELAARGHKVTVLHPGTYTSSAFESVSVSYPRGPVPGTRVRATLAGAAKRRFRRAAYDFVYTRGSLAGVVQAARDAGIRVAVEYNGVLLSEMAASHQPQTAIWRARLRESKVSKLCDVALAVEDRVRRDMMALYPDLAGRVQVCGNGAAVPLFAPLLSVRSGLRQKFLPSGCSRLVAFAGGLFSWTDIETGIRALAMLDDSHGAALVTRGPGLGDLRRLAADLGILRRIRFLGQQPHGTVRELMVSADTGLGLTDIAVAAGAPLKLSEYLAAGCCPVATRRDELSWIEREQLGHLAAARSVDDTARALAAACSDHAQAESARLRRHQYAARHLSWSTVAARIETILRENLAQPRR